MEIVASLPEQAYRCDELPQAVVEYDRKAWSYLAVLSKVGTPIDACKAPYFLVMHVVFVNQCRISVFIWRVVVERKLVVC